MSEVKILERKEIPEGAVMLFGLPDVGLVGVIAASHLVSELKLEEVAYVDSELLPPLIVLHEGLPHSPVRIFGDHNVLLAVSETAIQLDTVYAAIMHALVDWGISKNVRMMLSMSGNPVQDRQDIEELQVFATASNPEMLQMVQDKAVKVLKEGYMVGPQAIMMQYCANIGFPAITLLAQCFFNYPDPKAAAALLDELAKITRIRVDVSKLLEKGEEIRLRARDVMRRTQQEMTKMKKTQEYDIPLYVS